MHIRSPAFTWPVFAVKRYRTTRPLEISGSSAALNNLAERILDGVFDEHGGADGGGRALRSALRRQDLTKRCAFLLLA